MANVRILHVAHFRLDEGFDLLDAARTERAHALARHCFASLADTVKREKIDILLLGPESLSHGYASAETVRLFKETLDSLAPTCVLILPGKSDAYSEHSLYAGMRFSPNVRVFHENALRKVTLQKLGVTVYGRARLEHEITPPLSAVAEEDGLIHVFFGQGDETAEELSAIGADVAFLSARESGVTTECGTLICRTAPTVRREAGLCGLGTATLLELENDGAGVLSCDTHAVSIFPLHYESVSVVLDGALTEQDVHERLRAALADCALDGQSILTVTYTGTLPIDFPVYALGNAVAALCGDFFYTEMKNETSLSAKARTKDIGSMRGLTLHSALVSGADECETGERAEALRAASAALEGRRIGDVLSL